MLSQINKDATVVNVRWAVADICAAFEKKGVRAY